MKAAVRVFLLVLSLLTSTARTDPHDCEYVKISGTQSAHVSGNYYEQEDCLLHDLFVKSPYYLYYHSGMWLVSSRPCVDPNSTVTVYIRIRSSAPRPELASGVWQERSNTGDWSENPSIKVSCRDHIDDSFDLDPGIDDDDIWMIVGITIAVIVAIIAIVLSVIYCPRKQKPVKPAEPVPQPTVAYYQGGSTNVAFIPGNMPAQMPEQRPEQIPAQMTGQMLAQIPADAKMMPAYNPWATSQTPAYQVSPPSYNQTMNTEKGSLPDGNSMPQQGQIP